MKTVSILGSTGSIGRSALRVAGSFPDLFKISALSCGSNISLFREQLERYKPSCAAVADTTISKDDIDSLKDDFPKIQFFEGAEGVAELASREADILLASIVGGAGLIPTLRSLPHIKRLALANKETLVMAGDIVKKEAAKYNVEIIPVDSEHSAIFALINDIQGENIERILLTASGGSLRDKTLEELKSITPEEALKHPTWNMGAKITIDSATLINKGLEVIEAHHLFNMPYSKIDVIIHPESIIHSMVESVDGAVYAHMGVADMAHPILSAFSFPSKLKNPFGRLDLVKAGKLTFREYDPVRFPGLKLAFEAGNAGGIAPAVLNGANEAAVEAFLDRKIAFTHIVPIIKGALDSIANMSSPSFEDILEADRHSREIAKSIIRSKS